MKNEFVMPTDDELAEIDLIMKLSNMPLFIKTKTSSSTKYTGFFWLENGRGRKVYPYEDSVAIGWALGELKEIRYFLEKMLQ
jgi:hypothetical protein